jgi:hypothetical protein
LDLGVKRQRIKAWRQRFLQTGIDDGTARDGDGIRTGFYMDWNLPAFLKRADRDERLRPAHPSPCFLNHSSALRQPSSASSFT